MKIPITPWDDQVEDTIIRVPNRPLDELKTELAVEPLGLLPPYHWGEWEFNATSTAMVRGAFPNERILAPIAAGTISEAKQYIQTFLAGGADAFVLPHIIGNNDVAVRASRWAWEGWLTEGLWYHLAGSGDPPREVVDILRDIPATWTWSEEAL